jgi:hypothetical protein
MIPGENRARRLPGSAAELPWSAFMKRHTGAHLLMGVFTPDEKLHGGKRSQLVLLRGLGQALCARGAYSVTILRDLDGGDLAMVGVAHRTDADRISRTLAARTAPRFDPWRSHRSFNIDARAYRRIALALVVA